MTLQRLKDLLLTITPSVFHYEPPDGQTGSYLVWAEDGESDAVHADGEKVECAITGTIDYFTTTENDPVVKQIETALDSYDGLAWYMNSIQNEKDTGYIHYEWIFEIDGAEEGEDDG
ncbi:MAG: hypothetical protein GXX10_05900 [Clostridiaceae bacterium]|nr:hypothetical protein [Clostridiaceae bacterium]